MAWNGLRYKNKEIDLKLKPTAGIARKQVPNTAKQQIKILLEVVSGLISPYPIVVRDIYKKL